MKITNEKHDFLNDEGLDEMQKIYTYKLAFKCFKALYWSNIAFTFIPWIFQSMTDKSPFYAIISILLFIVTNIIYLIFGAKASRLGALNPSFAKHMAKPATIVAYVSMIIIYTVLAIIKYNETGEGFFIYLGIYTAIMAGTYIALGFIAKKNNKITEEVEEE